MALFNFGEKKEEKKAPTCCCGSTETKVEETPSCCCGSAPEAEAVTSCCCKPVEGICCIKVLGAGCKSCHEQYEYAKKAVSNLGLGIEVEYITDHGVRTDPTPLRCRGSRFAEIFVRRPRCLGVRHFLCTLRTTGKMAFASAQVHYVLRGKER